MPCNSPNKVFYIGINKETGKKKVLFTGRDTTYIYRNPHKEVGYYPDGHPKAGQLYKNEGWSCATDNNPQQMRLLGYDVIEDSDLVPCGQCIGCRLDYARSWATRCMIESEKYPKDELWYVTVTYNDESLPPRGEALRYDTGEYVTSDLHTVSKDDHKKFLKDLRYYLDQKYPGQKLRFFMSAEYGDLSYRPHMHYLFFGLKIPDLKFSRLNWRGDAYYTSEWLSDIWKKGNVIIGDLEFDSCNYVARYICKKQKGQNAKMYDDLGISPEFCIMSRKPGIGKDYFDENFEDIYSTDEIILPSREGAIQTKPSRYFDNLLERLDHGKYESIKSVRKKIAEDSELARKTLNPFFDDEDLFSARERRLSKKVILKKKGEI